jgi:hypothetical protein
MPLNLHGGCAVHLRLTPSGYVPKQLYTHVWDVQSVAAERRHGCHPVKSSC